MSVETKKSIWRSTYLGNSITDEQWDNIANGSFKGMFIGDYWTLDGVAWRIVDFDYWYGIGGVNLPKTATHHVVIMPDLILDTGQFNTTNTSAGGYANSDMRNSGISKSDSRILKAFGENHILTHEELLVNAMTNGLPQGVGFYIEKVTIPSEIMIYGSSIYSPNGSSTCAKFQTFGTTQLSAFCISRHLMYHADESWWLRDAVDGTRFSMVVKNGYNEAALATDSNGIRPVFGICK